MTTIAIFNQKGGVGKTTTSLNLTAALQRLGKAPLAIDLDPQAHLSGVCGIQPTSSLDTIWGFFRENRSLSELERPMPCGAHLIPAHFELHKVETLFGKGPKALQKLAQGIRDEMLAHPNTPVIIDCCPLLGVLALNAIFAAGKVLVPISADYLSLKGTQQLDHTLKALEHVLRERVERRYVITRYDFRRRMAREIAETLRQRYGSELCETRISENIALAESPAQNLDVFSFAPHSPGARDYEFLLDELISTGFLQ
jgi:chromosome partitioning protein